MKKYFILLIPFLISACANPINRHTAIEYSRGCRALQAQNEWWKARMACGRALTNAKLGRASDNELAIYWYEYGRTSGAICDYVEAQKGLEEAIKLDEATGGPLHMSLIEMAKLKSAQRQFGEALDYYKRGVAIMQNRAEKEDPLGLAKIFEEQAEIYRQLGNTALSKEFEERAQKLRRDNPDKKSRTDHTPYGKFCHQKS